MLNLALPGNPRYQPKELQKIFGYDNLYGPVGEVEIATMETLGEIGIIPPGDIMLLTPELKEELLTITTSEVDKVEREVTKHDIRAWVMIAKAKMPPDLSRWLHIPLTSYDVLDTARALQFARAHLTVVKPLADRLAGCFAEKTKELAEQKQIGRTHGQHALPITAGFWLATILNRILCNIKSANLAAKGLIGKISGAVGAYNAQKAVGITSRCDLEMSEKIQRFKVAQGLGSSDELPPAMMDRLCSQNPSFEGRVLQKLGLKYAAVSTQIVPPEPLADYLFACVKLSATLGQFGRDGRNLMRTEIAEMREPFAEGQVGSSTMAHKRNPITFENLEGTWQKTKNEFGNVLDTLISDHQRDLTGSTVSREFPTIVVNLATQLNALLREKDGVPFIMRVSVDAEACRRNLALQGDSILAEPAYIILQMLGYTGDAHELVNRKALAMKDSDSRLALFRAVYGILEDEDPEMAYKWDNMAEDMRHALYSPEEYIGLAKEKALEIAAAAEAYLKSC